MFIVGVLVLFVSSAFATDKCLGQIQVKPVLKEKGGVFFTKLEVDSSVPIEIPFNVPTVIDIDDLDWKLNQKPIDVDENEVKSAVYWKRANESIILVIREPVLQYIGTWEVEVKGENDEKLSRSCILESPPMVQRFVESFRETEGYELKVICKSSSIPYPEKLIWYRVDGSGNDMKLIPATKTETTHITGDTLVFKEVQLSDSGAYVCNTTIINGQFDSSVAEVKIKSRFSALWPFIGILAELIILLITIILYERHKAAKKKALAQNDSLLATPVSPSGDTKAHRGVRA